MSNLVVRHKELREMNLYDRVQSAIKSYLNYLPQSYLDDFLDDLHYRLENDEDNRASVLREIRDSDNFSIGQDQVGDLIVCSR